MPTIVYHVDPKTGNKYAYESKSFRDPETKKVKTKKTYLGRVDPISGEIIPKAEPGKRNRRLSTRHMEQLSAESKLQIEELSNEVTSLKNEVSSLTERLEIEEDFIQTVLKASAQYQDATKNLK